jgi:hypothetical protein
MAFFSRPLLLLMVNTFIIDGPSIRKYLDGVGLPSEPPVPIAPTASCLNRFCHVKTIYPTVAFFRQKIMRQRGFQFDYFCGFGNEVQTFTVANNFLVSPEPGSVFEAPVSGETAEGNIIGVGNEIIAHPPQEWEDFRPSESSSAVGAASPMHQWFFDFARDDRPHTASAGALEPSF